MYKENVANSLYILLDVLVRNIAVYIFSRVVPYFGETVR